MTLAVASARAWQSQGVCLSRIKPCLANARRSLCVARSTFSCSDGLAVSKSREAGVDQPMLADRTEPQRRNADSKRSQGNNELHCAISYHIPLPGSSYLNQSGWERRQGVLGGFSRSRSANMRSDARTVDPLHLAGRSSSGRTTARPNSQGTCCREWPGRNGGRAMPGRHQEMTVGSLR
jgi:hypothetical protein